jgi:phage tail tape-measure protein
MVLAWTFIVALILALVTVVFSGFLPTGASEGIRNLAQGMASAAGSLAGAGVAGIVVAVAALLLALLGGFFGGRLGSRYHTEIDRAS